MLHARARRHKVDDFAGTLSIKTVVNGTVTWKARGRELAVDPHSFLVLGDGEKYSMDIDSPHAVETACIFFRSGFVETVTLDATTPVEEALDDPGRRAPALAFLSKLHADPQRAIAGQVQSLAVRCTRKLQPSGYEEDFLLLSNQLLALYREIRARMGRVPALKTSTKEELFRRLEIGRELLHSDSEEPFSLETAARTACLSRYHFHRAFTTVYRKTPHTYLTELRLARALRRERIFIAALTLGSFSDDESSWLFIRWACLSKSAIFSPTVLIALARSRTARA